VSTCTEVINQTPRSSSTKSKMSGKLPEGLPISFVLDFYDEKLEAEYILRTRSLFEEFVCPKTGIFLMCTFNELLCGLTRLWSLGQEMKRFSGEIHERLINLPILFMIVLIRIIEKEYTHEEHEKSTADPQVAEVLLPLFHDMRSKINHFKRIPVQTVIFNTCLIYLRHLLNIIDADKTINRMKWHELRVESCRVLCPLRENDVTVIKEALVHFRDQVLPNFSKRKVKYNMKFVNKYPEVMEPTRQTQKGLAMYIYKISFMMIVFSLILLGILQLIDPGKGNSSGGGGNDREMPSLQFEY
jgi:hypothetical protein